MSVKISGIEKGSIAERKKILPGEKLNSINGHDIMDVLDYRFYQVNKDITVEIENVCGEKRSIDIKKGEYEEIGIIFDTYLIDKQHSCRNKCIFCFIDQLPKGMRETLYFKDDDSRLSFLFGNYVTLTNLDEREISRIIDMHISPINVSVHTTNPELRVKMMKNRFAGDSLKILNRFADAGIKMNCQIVSCVGINDGEELKRTLSDLEKLGDNIESIAVVPVGITKYREGLCELKSYTKGTAKDVIDIIETCGEMFLKKYGIRKVYPADEFYLKAEMPLPNPKFYEGFPQIENGVGMISSLREEFLDAIEDEDLDCKERNITIACGVAVKPFIREISNLAENRFDKLRINVIGINNNFFGDKINVSGLITGQDLINQLKDIEIGEEILISSSMLKDGEDIFLDDVTLNDVKEKLNVDVIPVDNDGYKLLEAMIGRSEE